MIAKVLSQLIKQSNSETKKIAKKLSVSEELLDDWCSGKDEPKYSDLIKITKYFDIHLLSLFEKKFSLKDIEKKLAQENQDILEDNKLLKDKLIDFALGTKQDLEEMKKLYDLQRVVIKPGDQ